ncbi:hypothetical protein KIW84_014773 [Lathyrus oleraceus]|uniref:Uncharacterized protein n=1 Tax=Pisum sativum TaxID=3888 RepID=A0A9D5BNY8_PEA|nr:hypothetical protein KIW84_014773 [Pisum sativum]
MKDFLCSAEAEVRSFHGSNSHFITTLIGSEVKSFDDSFQALRLLKSVPAISSDKTGLSFTGVKSQALISPKSRPASPSRTTTVSPSISRGVSPSRSRPAFTFLSIIVCMFRILLPRFSTMVLYQSQPKLPSHTYLQSVNSCSLEVLILLALLSTR